MISERIIKNIEGWIKSNEGDIKYKQERIQFFVKEITELQTAVDDFEWRNKENREAIAKLKAGETV